MTIGRAQSAYTLTGFSHTGEIVAQVLREPPAKETKDLTLAASSALTSALKLAQVDAGSEGRKNARELLQTLGDAMTAAARDLGATMPTSTARSTRFLLERFSPKQILSITFANRRINLWEGAVSSGKTIASLWTWLMFVERASTSGELVMIGKTRDAVYRNALQPLMNPEIFEDLALQVDYNPGALRGVHPVRPDVHPQHGRGLLREDPLRSVRSRHGNSVGYGGPRLRDLDHAERCHVRRRSVAQRPWPADTPTSPTFTAMCWRWPDAHRASWRAEPRPPADPRTPGVVVTTEEPEDRKTRGKHSWRTPGPPERTPLPAPPTTI
ncbi:hypothetical protein ACFVAM_04685 [Streptomyces californicus]|uniref:hypothetical protein n=1 Tax=Streptomyces californicus TaxID=67351 RepID=UPI00369D2F0C